MEPTTHTYVSQRLELNYVMWGNKDAPKIVLLHGGRDHARNWDLTAETLSSEYCVIAPDLRGHGDSDWAEGGSYSIIDYVLDLNALFNEADIQKASIIGHSLGGSIALQYAGAFPEQVDRVVSIEGVARMQWRENQRKPAHERLRKWVKDMRGLEIRNTHTYPSLESACERMKVANPTLSPELAYHLTLHGTRKVDESFVWKFDNHVRTPSPYEFNMEDARDIWNQIRCPILFLVGSESWGKQPESLDLSAFHNFNKVKIDNAGHWVQHDQFAKFMAVVSGFLNQ